MSRADDQGAGGGRGFQKLRETSPLRLQGYHHGNGTAQPRGRLVKMALGTEGLTEAVGRGGQGQQHGQAVLRQVRSPGTGLSQE